MSEKFVIVLNTVETSSCEESHGLSKCLAKVKECKWNRVVDFVEKYKDRHKLECEMDYSCGAHGCMIYFDLREIVEKAVIIPYNVENKELVMIIDALNEDDFINLIDQLIEDLSNQMGLTPSDDEEEKYENTTDENEKDVSKLEIKESQFEKESKAKQGQKRKISDLTSFDSDSDFESDSISEKAREKRKNLVKKKAKTVAEMKNEPAFEISSSDEES